MTANGHGSAGIDWNYFISDYGKSWQPASIRGLFPLEKRPNMISLLAGKPNSATFPFSSIQVTLKPVFPGDAPKTLTVESTSLDEGLQYGPTAGLTDLVSWLEDLQQHVHKRKRGTGEWRCSIGSGSQDLICKAFASVINDGDSILLETPCYPGILGMLKPYNVDLVEVPVDGEGLQPDVLEAMLANWSSQRLNTRFPKVLYTMPTGSNPAGCSSPLERKRQILSIAERYNLLIFEDDAYYFLHFDKSKQAPSYFALQGQRTETGTPSGRVVRFDSFSKIMSSGMRLGVATAHPDFLKIVDLHTANTNLQPNSTTQAMAAVLLKHWGIDGFLAHCDRVAAFYKAKRDMFEKAAKKHLTGLATWVSPDCGMFLYLSLDLPEPADSNALISTTAVEKGVLAVPGVSFMPTGSVSNCVRVSFSLATEREADEAFRRLRECLLEARA